MQLVCKNRILLVEIKVTHDVELKKKKSFPVADISLFGYQGKVDYEVLDDRVRITPPCINPNNFKGQYAYVFNIKQA